MKGSYCEIYNKTYIHATRSYYNEITSCYSTGSKRPHSRCLRANKVKYINRRQIWTCPSITPKTASSGGPSTNARFLGPTSPHPKRHVDPLSRFARRTFVTNRHTTQNSTIPRRRRASCRRVVGGGSGERRATTTAPAPPSVVVCRQSSLRGRCRCCRSGGLHMSNDDDSPPPPLPLPQRTATSSSPVHSTIVPAIQ